MTTITIPPSSLGVGTHTFSGNIADGLNQVAVTLDRTTPGGLNSLTAASFVAVTIGQSDDGGASWYPSAGTGPEGWPGGTVPTKAGPPRTADHIATQLEPGTGRKAQLTVVVGGPVAVGVAGTIVTS